MTEKKLSSQQKDEKHVLMQAFKSFSLETERLELTYKNLEERFKSTETSLQDTRIRLQGKLAELGFATSYLDAILSHMSQGILFIDVNGIVTTYNKSAESIFKIDIKDILFRFIWEFFHDHAFGFSLKEVLHSKQCPKLSVIHWERDGEKLELEIEATFVMMPTPLCSMIYQSSPSNSVQGLLILVRNITEFRRLQIMANRRDRLQELGEVTARMAHEIRNPLGGIKGFASLLKQDLKDRPDLEHMAIQIMEGTDNLNGFVSSILNYTRPFQLQCESIDLVPFIGDILQLVQVDKSLIPGTLCKLECKRKELIALVDPQLLKSALLNLCMNALQAMPKTGVLTIVLDKLDDQVCIVVRDQGVGIPEDHLDKIFSPFFTTKKMGNGLGLSEVHKIIQAHGGTIEVQSQIGMGASFIIKIPLRTSS